MSGLFVGGKTLQPREVLLCAYAGELIQSCGIYNLGLSCPRHALAVCCSRWENRPLLNGYTFYNVLARPAGGSHIHITLVIFLFRLYLWNFTPRRYATIRTRARSNLPPYPLINQINQVINQSIVNHPYTGNWLEGGAPLQLRAVLLPT